MPCHALAAHCTALLFGRTPPDSAVLVGGQRIFEAFPLDLALPAHGLGGLDLLDRRTGGADREEQVGVGVAAGAVFAPVVIFDVQVDAAALHQGHGTSTADSGHRDCD